jgi:glycine dehydrogenase subunit 1
MPDKKNTVHPYIPNSVPEVKAEMLRELGVSDIEELYQEIPVHLRFKGKLDIPDGLPSEYELKRHVEGILNKNLTCRDNLNFLGGGCWQHYVPAVCDEINRRSEFLTAYAGEAYEDHGRFQSLFEYQSLMGELLDMDVVNVPTYDWCQSAATTIRMACRITKRNKALISSFISPERMSAIKNYCHPVVKIETIEHDLKTGLLDLNRLDSILKRETDIAGVYFENPNYFGVIETQGEMISSMIHDKGGLSLVGTDPISLGILKPPALYGADIVCGDIQPLGMHLNYGGGQGGFIATRDEEKFVMEFPSRLFGITKTSVEDEYGFGDVAYERTSFDKREAGKEFVGTHSALWGITAGVYLALMGPQGMQDLGQTILQKSLYTQKTLAKISGLKAPKFQNSHFKEFVIDFNQTGKTVKEINQVLLNYKIFGGKDLSLDFPELGQSALYCITEIHTKDDIDRLSSALSECLLHDKRRQKGNRG